MLSINCKGRLIDLSAPKVMGIINVTPDSFYDGGNTTSEQEIVDQAGQMLVEGAAFLDVGGYSSRPGAEHISIPKELDRVLPAISTISKVFPEAIISIDTFRSEVARAAVAEGAGIVNDISAGNLDAAMLPMIAELKIPYVGMHMRGTPQNMITKTDYQNVSREVLFYFSEKLSAARKLGINDFIVDPGFGFSKTRQQCFQLLSDLELFKSLEVPVLVGLSRKSMIYKTLKTTPTKALNGTTALNSIALFKGANILRVHDVREAVECTMLIEELNDG